jgi:hypothetical protein
MNRQESLLVVEHIVNEWMNDSCQADILNSDILVFLKRVLVSL